MAKNNYKQ